MATFFELALELAPDLVRHFAPRAGRAPILHAVGTVVKVVTLAAILI